MKRGILIVMFFSSVVVFSGCQGNSGMTPDKDPSAANQSILIDASRGGGVWWFPQTQPFNPNEPHQGKALTDTLRALGYSVTVLTGGATIDIQLFKEYDLIIRASGRVYSDAELSDYVRYVSDGGNLLLLSEFIRSNGTDKLALAFGIRFTGITSGSQLMNFFPHSVTAGVKSGELRYGVGSGIIEFPAGTDIVAALDSAGYLDLNDNSVRDANEPFAPSVMGTLKFNNGKILFAGDTNFLQTVPQPLIDNILNWFM